MAGERLLQALQGSKNFGDATTALARYSGNPMWKRYAEKMGGTGSVSPPGWFKDFMSQNPGFGGSPQGMPGAQPMPRPMTPEMMGQMPQMPGGLQGGQMMPYEFLQSGVQQTMGSGPINPQMQQAMQQMRQQYSPGQAAGGQPQQPQMQSNGMQRLSPGIYRNAQGQIVRG